MTERAAFRRQEVLHGVMAKHDLAHSLFLPIAPARAEARRVDKGRDGEAGDLARHSFRGQLTPTRVAFTQ